MKSVSSSAALIYNTNENVIAKYPDGCHKCMVPLHIVLLYTIISTTSKCKANDLMAYLNYVPPKTEKDF